MQASCQLKPRTPVPQWGTNAPFLQSRADTRIAHRKAACDDVAHLILGDDTDYLDRIHPEVAMWREAVCREREAVDIERETIKGILRREQQWREKERTAKWDAIKREMEAVHKWREESQKREAAEHREARLQRMLKDANTHLLASTGKLSMRGILEAAQELAEKAYPEEVAALKPDSKDGSKQNGFEASVKVLLKHDTDLADKLAEVTQWSTEQLPSKLDQLRRRLSNPLYSKGLAVVQGSKEHVQLLLLKGVTDEKDFAALECLCTNLWFVSFYEMSMETYNRYVKALGRSSM